MVANTGRLELTWTNKHLTLLSAEDGSYEWVDPSDVRVAETRLLDEVEIVGDDDGAPHNLLIRGDSLQALRSLRRLPEFAEQYVGKVKLIYIDPPFNTGQAFANYDDALEHSVWLTMMRDRLVELKRFLSPEGSIWVHLDDSELHRLWCLLDEVLGSSNLIASFVWEKDKGRRNDTTISSAHDTIVAFARNVDRWKKVANPLPRTRQQEARYQNPDSDPRGPWLQGDNSTAKSGSDALRYPVRLPSGRVVEPPSGYFWRYSRQTLDNAIKDDRVYYGSNGDGMPIVKRYLSEVKEGVTPRTWWAGEEAGTNQSAKRDHLRKLLPDVEPFATPKPEQLLRRILTIATEPGDLVLDCFAGSGTTAAAAHKLGRRWVAIERSADTVKHYTQPRLEMVVAGADPMGISTTNEFEYDLPLVNGVERGEARRAAKVLDVLVEEGVLARLSDAEFDSDVLDEIARTLRRVDKRSKLTIEHWSGGGGFRVFEVAESMYELDDDGEVYLTESVTNGRFAEAVRAQLGFEVDDRPPFCGRKGRARLAVLDGAVGVVEASHLVGSLDETDRLVLVAKAVDPDVEALLAEESPGSKIRKAPRDLLRATGRVVR